MINQQRLPVLLVTALFALTLVACARDFAPLADAPPATTSPAALPPISLPADHAPHHNLSEWWYFTGHLTDDTGGEYGFEFVIFQADRGGEIAYAAHFALTDPAAGEFAYDQRTSFAHGSRQAAGLDLCVGGWTLGQADGAFAFAAQLPDRKLTLHLSPVKPAAIHNRDGLLDFAPYGWSYYYSYTRLDVSGELSGAGGPAEVHGRAWMDHQWGDFISVGAGGWDWFSLQLDDGRDFTASVVRGEEGRIVLEYATFVSADGVALHLEAGEFEIEALDEWLSPATGAVYPSRWRLVIPDEAIDLELRPTLADQELDARATTGNIYWEGAVLAVGEEGARGRGYVELTGYVPTATALSLDILTGPRADLCSGLP